MEPFDGRDVLGAAITIGNAGGGLHDALALDPGEYHKGQKLLVLLEVEVAGIEHKPIPKTDCWTRVHKCHAARGRIVTGEGYTEALDETSDAVARAREAAEGVTRLDDALAEKRAEFTAEHERGEHDDNLLPGCAECDDIILADDDEPESMP